MKRLLVFAAVILIPIFVILFYSYQKTSGIGSVEPQSFPGWQSTEQTLTTCTTQLKGYPFVYQSNQNCQQKFNPALLAIDVLLLAGLICLVGLLANYLKKPLPAGVRQIKLRLTEFRILEYFAGLCVVFAVYGILSGIIKLPGLVVLLLSGAVFVGTCYFLFNKWKQHDIQQKLLLSIKKTVLFFGGLTGFMIGLFLALLVAHLLNSSLKVQETFGYLALIVIFISFIVQILATTFRDVFKRPKHPKS